MWSSMYASCRSTQHTYIHICMAMYLGKGAFDMNLHSRRESCVAFHTHSKVYTHRHIHTLDLAKVQKMTEIYGVWDTQHYDKVTHTTWLTYTQSCAKACTYTHCTHRVEIYSVGGVGVITRTPCSAAFNGFKQKNRVLWWIHKTQSDKNSGERTQVRNKNTLRWDVPETPVLILYVWITEYINTLAQLFCKNTCPADLVPLEVSINKKT